MNTACIATFKDGHKEEYSSIEEASEKTGLSVASIKIRCNKRGCGGKDKTLFEWLDTYTKRSYQAKKSRTKGHGLELQVIQELTDLGFQGLVSSRSASRALDNAKVDIADTQDQLSCYIQCKATANTPNIEKISDECTLKDKPLVIIWKKQEADTHLKDFVLMPKDYFYHLLKYEVK